MIFIFVDIFTAEIRHVILAGLLQNYSPNVKGLPHASRLLARRPQNWCIDIERFYHADFHEHYYCNISRAWRQYLIFTMIDAMVSFHDYYNFIIIWVVFFRHLIFIITFSLAHFIFPWSKRLIFQEMALVITKYWWLARLLSPLASGQSRYAWAEHYYVERFHYYFRFSSQFHALYLFLDLSRMAAVPVYFIC